MSSSVQSLGPLILDVAGYQLTDEEKATLIRPGVGGVILFARNYESPEQLQTLTASIRALRPELLIAVDQEGGRVQRFREGFTRIPPMAELGGLYASQPDLAVELATDIGWLLASELIACGVDFSFAPVVDMDRGLSLVIGDRSFGDDEETVTVLAAALMKGFQQAGMASTLKHFPGHGGVQADSHIAIPVDSRSFAEIEAEDMQPFSRLLPQAQAIMPAHVIYEQCDEAPAGFSTFWLQSQLRQRLNFQGLIFSDDLTMEGASVAGGFAKRAEAALTAGCTMVLVCNRPEGAREVLDWLESQGQQCCPQAGSMRAAQVIDWSALRNTDRWHMTNRRIQQLIAERRES